MYHSVSENQNRQAFFHDINIMNEKNYFIQNILNNYKKIVKNNKKVKFYTR